MKKIALYSLCLFLMSFSNVWATNFAVITSPPTILNIVIFLVALGCLFGTVKIMNLIKGGQLFKSWQFFMIAFIVLAVCQTAILLKDFEILAMPVYVVPALVFLTFGLFLYGVWETKKTLE